jgi:pyruvate dehydrogenase E1 component beta subunit
MAILTIAQALNTALDQALSSDASVMLLGEDVGRTGGVFRITDGLQARYGADRVVDSPLAESGIAGVGLGLAIAGMRPVLEMQFMGFSYPAFDQVISHISRIRNRSRHRFTAPLVIRIPYGGGIGAAEHHAESSEAIYAHTPGVKVVVPSRPVDALGLMASAIADPDPVMFLEPIRLYRAVKEDVADTDVAVPLGQATVEREGSDLTLVAWGAMMREARHVADVLDRRGVSPELVDVRSLVPLDIDTLAASVSKTGRAVVVHEAPRTAGFGAEIVAQLHERCAYDLVTPVARVTGWDTVFPLRRAEHHYLPTSDRILAAAEHVLEG